MNKTTWMGLLLLATALAVGCGGGESSDEDLANRVAEALSQTPTPQPTILTTVQPAPSPTVKTRTIVREVIPSPTVIIEEVEAVPVASFGDGVHVVGEDIEPGTYRSSGSGDFCYWARLSGFTGDLGEIIANGIGEGQQVATIRASDAGFESSDCGTWARIE